MIPFSGNTVGDRDIDAGEAEGTVGCGYILFVLNKLLFLLQQCDSKHAVFVYSVAVQEKYGP